jgi:DNA-binding SARP family transcriptional activator
MTGNGARLRLEVLGQLRAWLDDVELDLGQPMQRGLLTILSIHVNELLSRDTLVDELWGENPPQTAVNSVHTYIKGLRQAFGADERWIVTEASAYRLDLAPSQIDLHLFRQDLARARQHRKAGDLAAADEAFTRALYRWHGTPLGGVAGEFVDRLRTHLADEYSTALEEATEVALERGTAAALLHRLTDGVTRVPSRETTHYWLMLTLCQAGRPADALDHYDELRRFLRDELGVDPSEDLRLLHQKILDEDPTLPRPTPGHEASRAITPAQLPAGVWGFTGREPELALLDAWASAHDALPAGPSVAAVTGTAGVGKTALAVHWAQRAAAAFPDGCLYVNLRGYHPDPPMPASNALAGFLRSLGVEGGKIPRDTEERAALYRSRVAGRRLLIVLDNAHSFEQVRPLLPGTTACFTVVTSRDVLAGLTAHYGSRRIKMDPLTPEDADALLRDRIESRVIAEPEAAVQLAERCARLPLAMVVAADVAKRRDTTPLADLVEELDFLDAGDDPQTAVRRVLSWSYRYLGDDVAHLFRLGGVHPGAELEPLALATLARADVRQTKRSADALVRASLWAEVGPRRYRLHDLLRQYAWERALEDEPADERRAALVRLIRWYLHAAAAAELQITKTHRRVELEPLDGTPPPLEFADEAEALQWCEGERENLVAASARAFEEGLFSLAWKLPVVLGVFFYLRKYWTDWLGTHKTALTAADEANSPAGKAMVLSGLGNAHYDLKDYEQAIVYHEQALEIRRGLHDVQGTAASLMNLGEARRGLEDYETALPTFAEAFDTFTKSGNQYGQAMTLTNIANLHLKAGSLSEALAYAEQALEIRKDIGDDHGMSFTLNCLGDIYRGLGRLDDAKAVLRDALSRRLRFHDECNAAATRCSLADVLLDAGQPDEARDHLEAAATALQDLDREQAEVVRRRIADLRNGAA